MSKTVTMEFIGLDDWDNPVYKCIETGVLWKDLALKHADKPALYSCGNEFDGDPCYPIKEDLKVKFKTRYKEDPYKQDYQLLSRLQSDCDYYLGYGNRYAKHLWAGNEEDQIKKMKELYNIFPADQKPEWLTWEQILQYEKEMIIDN